VEEQRKRLDPSSAPPKCHRQVAACASAAPAATSQCLSPTPIGSGWGGSGLTPHGSECRRHAGHCSGQIWPGGARLEAKAVRAVAVSCEI
jgi:hypothetical protein